VDKVQWSEDLSVGVPLIDSQHKMLIGRIQELSDAIRNYQGGGEVAKTLDFLMDYTDFHFGTEERHMRALNYPGLDEHLDKHQQYRDTLKNLGRDFEEEGATTDLADSIDRLLGHWFVEHIKHIDQKLGDFLKKHGVELAEEDGGPQG
jgi:hemerythrin-like metal-binding protein